MSIIEKQGNLFTSKCEVFVNTVNCVGIMGAGIALEFKLRYPVMYEKYKKLCDAGKLRPGNLWLYKTPTRSILNFPTKDHWRDPSRVEYLEMGLDKLAKTYSEKGVKSIALPLLGADKGGLEPSVSKRIIYQYLDKISDLEVELYNYDPTAKDEIIDRLSLILLSNDIDVISKSSEINSRTLELINTHVQSNAVNTVGRLLTIPGVGEATVAKLFNLLDTIPSDVTTLAGQQGSLL